ncbi:hypothetical protein QFZ35_004061 [Arthrobacter ulcerisalmonis]|uniref:hypothetical protein n=1 Tax=Arthrobacter sp. B1I2 TaxID=3042263 RepID=UPI00278A6AAE|nr:MULTISPECIES: hypothetical protein [Arthrobacter]MDQ0665563.1 hypothetical protein [Arthrobacter ulcerisalmonis]MDQ0729276.1 hypothetical protein [Arthrobacter sp. B1I2]
MTYFLEYTVPAAPGDAGFDFPHDEINSGTTVPLSETDAEVVHAPDLPARTGIIGATVPEAKLEAEQLITHSRATDASLYFDPSNSLQAGVGTLVSTFSEGRGWQDV